MIELPEGSYSVRLGFPGPNLCFGAAKGLLTATAGKHRVSLSNSGNGWDDFNIVWTDALNAFEAGEITHFVMLHSDIIPDPGWLDLLIAELDRLGADLVSGVAAIKDSRGLTSTGIGDMTNRWAPYRRFTVREILGFPETFSAADIGYEGWPILHNTGCWACDLRNPLFRTQNEDGDLVPFFDFPRRAYRDSEGHWVTACESEDWYFSRILHQLGAKTYVTRKLRLIHRGVADFPNWEGWGAYKDGDEDTAAKWRAS